METTQKTDWLPEEWSATDGGIAYDPRHEAAVRLDPDEAWFSGSDLGAALTYATAFYWNVAKVHKDSAYAYECAVKSLRAGSALELETGANGPRVEAEKILQAVVSQQIEDSMLEAHRAGILGEKKRAECPMGCEPGAPQPDCLEHGE